MNLIQLSGLGVKDHSYATSGRRDGRGAIRVAGLLEGRPHYDDRPIILTH